MYFFTRRKIKILFRIVLVGYLIPNKAASPIHPEDIKKIDPQSFWYYPWGESGVHKGIDLFCLQNTHVYAPVYGIVVQTGYGSVAGNYIYLLGPAWKLYYFAHLGHIQTATMHWVNKGEKIAESGISGNAAGKPAHLHFSIQTVVPYPWLYDNLEYEGWKKMFYLNPVKEIQF